MVEILLQQYHSVFISFSQFTALLKERVCNLVIALFSPKWTTAKNDAEKLRNFIIITRVLNPYSPCLQAVGQPSILNPLNLSLSHLCDCMVQLKWQIRKKS